jgi:hypothetical protein
MTHAIADGSAGAVDNLDPMLARYKAACTFKQAIDWHRILSALRIWIDAIGLAGDIKLCRVENASQASEATNLARHSQFRRDPWNQIATRAAGDCLNGSSARAHTSWLTQGSTQDSDSTRAAVEYRLHMRDGDIAMVAWRNRAVRDGWISRDQTVLAAYILWEVRYFAMMAMWASVRDDQPALRKWLPLFEAFEAGCFCLWFGAGTVWAAPIPSKVAISTPGNILHCADGPAFTWLNDVCDYYWQGVRVPQFVVEAPYQISVSTIDSETNAEVRRVMIDRYRLGEDLHGAAAYIRDAGGERLDHDERYGTLWRREMRFDEPIVMLEVVNATPETDGRFKRYWLRVPPMMATAHEAAAWTFALAPRE